jgi:hypothetical protein
MGDGKVANFGPEWKKLTREGGRPTWDEELLLRVVHMEDGPDSKGPMRDVFCVIPEKNGRAAFDELGFGHDERPAHAGLFPSDLVKTFSTMELPEPCAEFYPSDDGSQLKVDLKKMSTYVGEYTLWADVKKILGHYSVPRHRKELGTSWDPSILQVPINRIVQAGRQEGRTRLVLRRLDVVEPAHTWLRLVPTIREWTPGGTDEHRETWEPVSNGLLHLVENPDQADAASSQSSPPSDDMDTDAAAPGAGALPVVAHSADTEAFGRAHGRPGVRNADGA